MAPHSSTFAWKTPWTVEPGRLQSMGSLRVETTERLHFHFSLSCIGEGNNNPLQCFCLENPRDVGAWWAAIYGVTQSWTRLKWLSNSSRSSHFILKFSWLVLPKAVCESLRTSQRVPDPIFSSYEWGWIFFTIFNQTAYAIDLILKKIWESGRN